MQAEQVWERTCHFRLIKVERHTHKLSLSLSLWGHEWLPAWLFERESKKKVPRPEVGGQWCLIMSPYGSPKPENLLWFSLCSFQMRVHFGCIAFHWMYGQSLATTTILDTRWRAKMNKCFNSEDSYENSDRTVWMYPIGFCSRSIYRELLYIHHQVYLSPFWL